MRLHVWTPKKLVVLFRPNCRFGRLDAIFQKSVSKIWTFFGKIFETSNPTCDLDVFQKKNRPKNVKIFGSLRSPGFHLDSFCSKYPKNVHLGNILTGRLDGISQKCVHSLIWTFGQEKCWLWKCVESHPPPY